jgi:hypothetical protein
MEVASFSIYFVFPYLLLDSTVMLLVDVALLIGWMIFISCLLFSLFVFDSKIDDEVGWKIALTGMIITIIFPVLVLNIYWNILSGYWCCNFKSLTMVG